MTNRLAKLFSWNVDDGHLLPNGMEGITTAVKALEGPRGQGLDTGNKGQGRPRSSLRMAWNSSKQPHCVGKHASTSRGAASMGHNHIFFVP